MGLPVRLVSNSTFDRGSDHASFNDFAQEAILARDTIASLRFAMIIDAHNGGLYGFALLARSRTDRGLADRCGDERGRLRDGGRHHPRHSRRNSWRMDLLDA